MENNLLTQELKLIVTRRSINFLNLLKNIYKISYVYVINY